MKADLKCLVNHFAWARSVVVGMLVSLMAVSAAWAQSVTSDPANGATSVSVNATVTFTFSAAVDPTKVTVTFYSTSPAGTYTVNSTYSSGNTVLTCTPVSPWPGNATISWLIFIQGSTLPLTGTFSTGTGTGTGGGSGTNAITTFSVGKLYLYQQTNTSAPTAMTNVAYGFVATTALASNQTASAVTVTIPGTNSATGLSQNPVASWDYYFFDYNHTNSTSFEAAFPQGSYVYNVTGTPGNLQATINMATTMAQPNAPHISNFAAAQTVNAAQPFTVTWDAFQNGTSSDFIVLTLNDSGGIVFHTAYPGTNNAVPLPGTALSVAIPANTLSNNVAYTGQLVFYRYVATSNATYATVGYRASATQFSLNTSSGTTGGSVPKVSNPTWSGNSISFDVATSAGQALKVRFTSDCSLPISQWSTLLMTNSPGASVHITIPPQASAAGFFRLENGP